MIEKNKKTLTDFISALKNEQVPAEPPAKDIDSVLDNLAQATGGEMKTANKPITFSERIAAAGPIIKAVAALIIMAPIITFTLHIYQTKPPVTKETKKPQAISEKIKDENLQPKLDAELEKIERMFIARDIKGLLAMLNTSRFEIKVAAANYLAQIGDARVLAALDKLARQYEGGDNPFALAIKKINERLKPRPVKTAKKPPSAGRITDTPAKKSEDTEKTKVRDDFIHGWLVDLNDNPLVGEIQFGGPIVKTDDDGAFTIREPEYKGFYSVFGRAFNEEKTLGTFFIWEKTNNAVDAEIIVKPLAKVTGFVTDEHNNPIGDFDLEFSVSTEYYHIYNVIISDGPWEIQIQPDGSFEVAMVPTGVDLVLVAKMPGFKTAVKLDGLTAGKTLDLGQVVLEPLEGFSEDTTWDCIFKGFVLNEANEPIAGAKISAFVGDDRIELQTDENGWFEFVNLPTGIEMKMIVSAEGYGNNKFVFSCIETINERDVQIFPPAYDFFGEKAPGLFVRRWMNVEPFTLEQLTGQVVVLSINDYLRRPNSITTLTRIYEKYSSEPFTVIAIHSSSPQATANDPRLKQLIEKNVIEFPFGLDSDAKVTEKMLPPRDRPWDDNLIRVGRRGLQTGAMNSLYEAKYRYAYYLIDKNGILRASPSEDSLEQWIELLLSE
ncbi:MAG: redoxin domain-containing protein [Planctomycetes bacterium]|nr:redoxin domain-containing protein [Planctomycetota bacterium]